MLLRLLKTFSLWLPSPGTNGHLSDSDSDSNSESGSGSDLERGAGNEPSQERAQGNNCELCILSVWMWLCVCVCVLVRPGYNQGINKSQFLFATFHVVTERYEIHSSKFVARAISNDFITIDRAYGGADRQQTTKLTGNNNNGMENKLKNFLLSISLYRFFSWKIYSPLIWLFSYA